MEFEIDFYNLVFWQFYNLFNPKNTPELMLI